MFKLKKKKSIDSYITYLIGNLQYPTDASISEGISYISDLYDYADISVFSTQEQKVIYSNIQQEDVIHTVENIVRYEIERGSNFNLNLYALPSYRVRTGIKGTGLVSIDGADEVNYVICIDSYTTDKFSLEKMQEYICIFILLVTLITLCNQAKKINRALNLEPFTKLRMRDAFYEALQDEIDRGIDAKESVGMIIISNPDISNGDVTTRQRELFLTEVTKYLKGRFGNSVFICGEYRFSILINSDVYEAYGFLDEMFQEIRQLNDDLNVSCVITPLNANKTVSEHVYILESNIFSTKPYTAYIVREADELKNVDCSNENNCIVDQTNDTRTGPTCDNSIKPDKRGAK